MLVDVIEFQLSYFKFWKITQLKCCTQHVSKSEKLSCGHSTGKGQFSFQSPRRAISKNVLMILQLLISHASKVMFKFLQTDAKSLQSCLTLCDLIDGSPPGCPIPGILQARILEWVAISFSNAQNWKLKVKLLSRVRPSATPWTAAYLAPPSMGFSRHEYWSGVPLPSPSN